MGHEYVHKGKGLGGEVVGWLELTCPDCGMEVFMDSVGGQLGAWSRPVPGHEGLFWTCGGDIDYFRCFSKKHTYNWSDIPTECWGVHFFTEQEREEYERGLAEVRKYIEDHRDPKTGAIVFNGPRQRPV